jgi:hypothetical protein
VLLEIETHGRSSSATNGCIQKLEYIAGEKADFHPNNLGKNVSVTDGMVNIDGDKGGEDGVESAKLVGRVEGVQTSVEGGTQGGEVARGEVLMDKISVVDPGRGAVGPAQVTTKSSSINTEEGGCQEKKGGSSRPKVLRTRKGDLLLVGPSAPGSDCQAQEHVRRIKTRAEKHSTHRKSSNKMSNPAPPCNKYQKFANVIQHQNQNRPARRKKNAIQSTTISTGEHQIESDSIHNSDVSSTPIQQIDPGSAFGGEEFQLEVVLTGQTSAQAIEATVQTANQEGSGLACFLGAMDEAVRSSGGGGLETTTRQQLEAKKMLAIQKEVGVTIQQTEEEHLNRIVAMEVRDKAEKEGWELNRVNESSQ